MNSLGQEKTLICYGNNDYRDYLSHHGILGMHWGIRRFQPYSVKPRGSGKGGKEIGEAKTFGRKNNIDSAFSSYNWRDKDSVDRLKDVLSSHSTEQIEKVVNGKINKFEKVLDSYKPSKPQSELDKKLRDAANDSTYNKWAQFQHEIEEKSLDWYESIPKGKYGKKAYDVIRPVDALNEYRSDITKEDFNKVVKDAEEFVTRQILSKNEKYKDIAKLPNYTQEHETLDGIVDIMDEVRSSKDYQDAATINLDRKTTKEVLNAVNALHKQGGSLDNLRKRMSSGYRKPYTIDSRYNERRYLLSAVLMDLGYPNTRENRDKIEEFVYWD